MSGTSEIHSMLEAVRRRCNRLLVRRVALRALLIGSGIAALGSVVWIARGESVPGGWFFGVAVMSVGLGLSFLHHGWMDRAAAARFADARFGLKDGLATSLFLESEGDPAVELQRRWLAGRLAECRVGSIGGPFPGRMLAGGVAALAAAVALGLLPPSEEVLAAREEARETRERVEASKEQLEKLMEGLDEEIVAPGEREALKMDEFRKMVEEIDPTGDRTEAARQFARIEQKMRDASRSLDQRRDMETLERAAAELGKAEETEPRQLGKKLEARELKNAAEMLEKLKQKEPDPQELKKAKKEELAEAKEKLARMRAVTKRLGAAGRQRRAAAQAGAGAGAGAAGAGAGAGMAGGAAGRMAGGGEDGGERLEDLMAELDEAAEEMEEALEEFELDPDAEFEEGDFDGPWARANGLLEKFDGKLRRMDARHRAMGKLDRMLEGLARARGGLRGDERMLGLAERAAQAAGGQAPGSGSSWSEREEKDDSQKNGELAALKGQHGEGPSLSTVEAAESGTGVSGRRGEAKQREFAREVESFVQRDDVPEALKLGVRNYFENVESAAPSADDE